MKANDDTKVNDGTTEDSYEDATKQNWLWMMPPIVIDHKGCQFKNDLKRWHRTKMPSYNSTNSNWHLDCKIKFSDGLAYVQYNSDNNTHWI